VVSWNTGCSKEPKEALEYSKLRVFPFVTSETGEVSCNVSRAPLQVNKAKLWHTVWVALTRSMAMLFYHFETQFTGAVLCEQQRPKAADSGRMLQSSLCRAKAWRPSPTAPQMHFLFSSVLHCCVG
jgi:hypothetical protein